MYTATEYLFSGKADKSIFRENGAANIFKRGCRKIGSDTDFCGSAAAVGSTYRCGKPVWAECG